MTPTVTILTYCAHPALAYGTLLVFKTLRTGFPNARIEVYDNGSHPEVRAQVERAAANVGASFMAIKPCHFGLHLRWVLLEREHDGGPLVLLDPDVALWQDVEGWDFGDALMAGRLMPGFGKPGVASVASRLHPSHLWIPNVSTLRDELASRVPAGVDFESGSKPGAGGLVFWDTLAALYDALSDRCVSFDTPNLDAYDHLFFGSHMPIFDCGDGAELAPFREAHRAAAMGDLPALRGLWRRQEAFFRPESTGRCNVPRELQSLFATQVARSDALQRIQGFNYPGSDLAQAMAVLRNRVHGKVERS